MNSNSVAMKLSNLLEEINLPKTAGQNIDQSERLLSVLGGSYLLYKSIKNLKQHPLLGIQGALASGLLIYRGATGVCPVYEKLRKDTTDPQAITIIENITVNAPKEKVYRFWRELSNLPKFMEHLKQVTEHNDTQSSWEANLPGNIIPLKWDAQITREEENSYLGWQSLENAMIQNAGKVEFKESLNQIGTQIHIEISYFPPAGSVGRGLASFFNGIFEKMIRKDILSFKQYVEHKDFQAYIGITED